MWRLVLNMSDKSKPNLPPTPDFNPQSDQLSSSGGGTLNYNSTSSSLQTVIKHNEDLMARLSVNLRRVGHLEKVIEDLSLRFKVEKASSDSLRDELLIYTEKNRLSETQNQKILGDLNRTQKKLEFFQAENESLKSNLKASQTSFESKIDHLDAELRQLRQSQEITETQLKPKLLLLEDQVKKQNFSLEEARHKNEELKEKLLTLSHQAQSEALKFHNVSSDLQHKLKERDLILKQYENLDQKIKSLSKDKAILENKNIDLTMELKKVQSIKSQELDLLKEALAQKTNEVQKYKVENHELKKSWADSHAKTKILETQVQTLEEQSQSMNFMWQEKSKKINELENQNKIYENMRHDLSMKSKHHELEIQHKNKKINELLNQIESMSLKGQYEQQTILETAIRGIKNLSFNDEQKILPLQNQNETLSPDTSKPTLFSKEPQSPLDTY